MTKRYPPLSSRHPVFLHGGDYNPDQWLHEPDIIEEDFRLATVAHINSFSVGIFAWSALEPEEGCFEFEWLDRILNWMEERKMAAILATPSGARPAWLSFRYPEALRVTREGRRNRHEGRHNHCMTSPAYREKVAIINGKLAERYQNHPALALWHLSNEYGGECHCGLCYAAFRVWLQDRYDTLGALNEAWWTPFWSHTYTEWDQIEPQDRGVHGLQIDWMRFVTHQTTDFMKQEIAALRRFSKDIPVTTNMMGAFTGLDYWKMAPELDVISWDSYPFYHDRDDMAKVAAFTSMMHDLNRSMKRGKPFLLMESTPSTANWQPVNKLKRPGLHKLSSLQAVAHGADSVQYFQYRKSRGSSEKFHGAVIDHVGHENTRVFREVAEVGTILEKLTPALGTTVPAETAVIYDWENRWAIDFAAGPRQNKQYLETCTDHYRALWKRGVPVDLNNADVPLDGYKLVIAPMLYMIRPGVAERIAAFVKSGGTFVATFLTGIVNESDLCFLGGWPGPLRKVLGIWAEEIDSLYDDESNTIVPSPDNALGLIGPYTGRTFCDLIHSEGAAVLATYGQDFYAGRPCLTSNRYGEGTAYYLTTRADDAFLTDFYGALLANTGIRPALEANLPEGLTAQFRTDGERDFVFLMNFSRDGREVTITETGLTDFLTGQNVTDRINLAGYDIKILERASRIQAPSPTP